MATIIQNLPFYETHTTVTVADGESVVIKPRQIILWVSISKPDANDLPAGTPSFPAILDTGFNDSFLIQRQHLLPWAGISAEALVVVDGLRVYGVDVPLLDADVWLHANEPNSREADAASRPFRLELHGGVAVTELGTPRLPLLGMLALRRSGLRILIDCQRCRVSIESP